jgi:hypothetical protein
MLAAVCRGLAAAVVLGCAVGQPGAHAAPPPRAVEQPSEQGLQISLRSVRPAVVTSEQPLTLEGVVRNTTGGAVPRPVVQVVLGERALVTRADVEDWAVATGPAQGRVVGRQALPASLPPGAAAAFRVTVAGGAGMRRAAYGALPLSVEVGGSALRTFAGYQRVKEYTPLSVAWAVPLTLDADPALFGAGGAARQEAWERALGEGSRLRRVVDATEDAPVTWALDPTLVPGVLATAADAPAYPSPAGAADGGEQALRQAFEERLRAGAEAHRPWVLPDTDADVAAAATEGAAAGLVRTLVARAAPVAAALGGRADIAWPADGDQAEGREAGLRALYAGPGLSAQLAAQSRLPSGGMTADAGRRSPGGLPVLAYDDRLSALLARTRSGPEAALSAQRFVADSVMLLDESPGIERRVLVAAPRGFAPDPAAARAFLATVGSVPWLRTTTTEAVLRAAAVAVPDRSTLASRPEPTQGAVVEPGGDLLGAGPPILTTARGERVERALDTVRGVALIRDDGTSFARVWGRAAEQLASVRWRGNETQWSRLSRAVESAAQGTTSAIKVSPRSFNFLAESGRLQITVTNELDVAVENVQLSLVPANPRLRVDGQPPPLRIGANSRATVVVPVTSFAAGLVPIRTTLTTPDGTVIGQGADVQVRVSPTGDWVYWALGALAIVILLVGIHRSVRRRPGAGPTR